ncbi:MAG: hypothetical protein ACLGXA_05405 [Acidobacteriota bacterium]
MARIARRGFLQERVFPLFGRYPWQCAICGAQRLLRRRGATIRRTDSRSEQREPGSDGERNSGYPERRSDDRLRA